MKLNSPQKLQGIITPLVTPLLSNNELDIEGLEKLINHVIEGGVHGIFILGTTGELSSLNNSVKEEAISATCKIVNKRVPVLVGITDTSINESIKLANMAFQESADALVLAPPFYYSVDQPELLDYFRRVAESISLPMYLYNIPARTKISIAVESVLQASKIPGIVGLKDSSGDMFYFLKLVHLLKENPDFSIFIGPEEIMAPTVLFGASGGVNGGANIFPELFVQLYEATKDNDLEKVFHLQDIVTQISSTLYQVGDQNPNFIKIVKCVLSQKGICNEHMAGPYIPFSSNEKNEIAEYLEKINQKVASYQKVDNI